MENAETAWADDEQLTAAASPEALEELYEEPDAEPDAFATAPEAEPEDLLAAEALCPTCGELLAWHDEFASCRPGPVVYAAVPAQASVELDEFSQEATPVAEAPAPARPGSAGSRPGTFAYELGHRVQPTPTLTAEVIWRGQLKERHPATGLVHRVNVYRLNDGYWDCYREEELQAA
jgi:hypothetical protein